MGEAVERMLRDPSTKVADKDLFRLWSVAGPQDGGFLELIWGLWWFRSVTIAAHHLFRAAGPWRPHSPQLRCRRQCT